MTIIYIRSAASSRVGFWWIHDASVSRSASLNPTPHHPIGSLQRGSLTQVDCNIQDGQLPFPYCTVWSNNDNILCLGPEDVAPGTPSKCKCSESEVSVPLCIVSPAVF